MSIDDLERTYAAILLFQFRNESYNTKRRVCEERLIKFKSSSSEDALLYSNKRGKEEEYDTIQDNQHVWFEFIGIIDIFHKSLLDFSFKRQTKKFFKKYKNQCKSDIKSMNW